MLKARRSIALILILAFAGLASAQTLPEHRGWVNDFAGVIDSGTQRKMEALIGDLEEKTTAEIAVVTVSTTEPMSIEEYAEKLFEAWGVGKREKDNGVMLIVALKDRKVRIEVGYGLEGVITDGRAGEILDKYVVPDFRRGDYAAGLYNGLVAVANLIAAESGVELSTAPRVALPAPRPPERTLESELLWIVVAALGGFFAGIFVNGVRNRKTLNILFGIVLGGTASVALAARALPSFALGLSSAVIMPAVQSAIWVAVFATVVGSRYTASERTLEGVLLAIRMILSVFFRMLFISLLLSGGGRSRGYWSSGGGGYRGGGFGGFGGGRSGGGGASRGW
ncbi:MAG: TPM domain-containing protein [bacterium]